MEIIVKNLLENALTYSSFTAKENPKVTLKVLKENSDLSIYVRDNGEGIVKEVRSKIWNMFYVGNEHSSGNGLGLYITRKAVQVLNGKIIYVTKEREYTEFRVRLPFKKPPTNGLNIKESKEVKSH